MRTLVGGLALLSLLVTGCVGTSEDASTIHADSTGMMAEAKSEVLAADDISGTWNGTSMEAVGDSVTFRWTYTRNADGSASFVYDGSSDTVRYATVLSGDSIISTSEPYTTRDAPAGSPQIMVRTVGRLVDGKLVGTSAVTLASSPDSVVARGRWEAIRAP